MHLIIDGYNLLYCGRTQIKMNQIELQWERDRLINQLSNYRKRKPSEMIVVFDGWLGGWSTEKREREKGIDLIFSKLGEKADEVIKRLVGEKGSGVWVITSDRDISKYAERMGVPVIPSEQFRKKMESPAITVQNRYKEEEEEKGEGVKKKGPSRRLSKKEKRLRAALKKV